MQGNGWIRHQRWIVEVDGLWNFVLLLDHKQVFTYTSYKSIASPTSWHSHELQGNPLKIMFSLWKKSLDIIFSDEYSQFDVHDLISFWLCQPRTNSNVRCLWQIDSNTNYSLTSRHTTFIGIHLGETLNFDTFKWSKFKLDWLSAACVNMSCKLHLLQRLIVMWWDCSWFQCFRGFCLWTC